jgi:hypothetical protein
MTDCKHDWHFTSDGTMAMRCKKCGQETGPQIVEQAAEQLAQDMMQDALTIGSAWSKGGKRIDPASVFKDHGALHSCSYYCDRPECIKAQRDELRERLAQDFIKHEVDSFDDWSEWVCPDPARYFMKCCDCGLVHKMQFKVVKYSEGDKCEDFDDPYVQAVFRARRVTPPAAPVQPVQPEQEPKHYRHTWGQDGERCVVCGDKDWMGTSCKKISAPAAPVQEPRHIVQSNGRHSPLLTHMMNSRNTPPAAAPVQRTEQEPVAWAKFLHYPECWDTAAYPELRDAVHEALAWAGCSVCAPPAAQPEQQEPDGIGWLRKDGGYFNPPAAQRQPLTEEQINTLRQQYGVTSDGRGIKEFTYVVDFARAVEAAHGIKEKNK